MAKKKNEILSMLRDMEVDGTISYPYRKAASVRATISKYSSLSGRLFSTTTDDNKIYVKRIK